MIFFSPGLPPFNLLPLPRRRLMASRQPATPPRSGTMKEFFRGLRDNGIWPWTHAKGIVDGHLTDHTHDVPRNANGWPTIEPKFFTLDQLLIEAENWRNVGDHPNTVGQGKWKLYTQELMDRGFMDETDVKAWRRRGMPTLTKVEGGWAVEFPPVGEEENG